MREGGRFGGGRELGREGARARESIYRSSARFSACDQRVAYIHNICMHMYMHMYMDAYMYVYVCICMRISICMRI